MLKITILIKNRACNVANQNRVILLFIENNNFHFLF